MKKFTATLLLLFMTLTASADRFEVDGIIYESMNDTEVWISSFDNENLPEGPITIPATVTNSGMTYSVTAIGDQAFYRCDNLTSITIPNSVTSIGDYAFRDCSALTSITIPNCVTSIGDYAFWDCSGLTSIVVESGNSVYDSRENCNAIIETKTNTLIQGCNNSIIPNSVTSIGKEAFYHCYGLTSITIPNSVTSIGDQAFVDCSGLTSITIPNSVTSIGDQAFVVCN